MITPENCSEYEIYNYTLKCTEGWNEEADEEFAIYDNILPLSDMQAYGGVSFPNIQSIITSLCNGDEIFVGSFGNTEVYIQGDIGHEMYEEAVYASISLTAWTEVPDDIAAGGELLSVDAKWERESDPASESDGRKVLRWLYECFQDEWNAIFPSACATMGI